MPKQLTFNVLDIVAGTSVDGPGLRTAIYLAGCRHHCQGCHNPQSWDFHGGEEMTLSQLLERIEAEGFDVTLTGGDPLASPEKVARLAREIKEAGYGIWLYTGYTIEEILDNPILSNAVKDVDVIVEGRFVEALRDPDLQFRGSSNQRIMQLIHDDSADDNDRRFGLNAKPWTPDW